MDILIRELGEDDAGALASLLTESTGLSTTAEQARSRLHLSRGIEHPVVAEINGNVVGFASLRLLHYLGDDRPYAEVSELFVRKNWRRRGIALALFADLETKARAARAGSWCVLTGPDNEAATSFYHKAGFTEFAVALQRWFIDERPYRVSDDLS